MIALPQDQIDQQESGPASGIRQAIIRIEGGADESHRIVQGPHAPHVHAVQLVYIVLPAEYPVRATRSDVIGNVAVQDLVQQVKIVAAGNRKGKQVIAPLELLIAAMLQVKHAPQIVGGFVFERRFGIARDVAGAVHIGILAVADECDVAHRFDAIAPAERGCRPRHRARRPTRCVRIHGEQSRQQ